jgi:hypothetical protein
MDPQRRKALGAAAALGFALTATAAAAEPPERHPHIRAALREIREAQNELKTAAHDFGGHRVEAMQALTWAAQQLEACLQYDRN